MFSQTVEYALRAMAYLADHAGKSQPNPSIAEATKVPSAYLAKVLRQLVQGRLLKGQRGPNGGFTLACSPEDITIWDVVEAVEPIRRIKTCPLALSSHNTNLCPLHRKLDDALAILEKTFKATSLSQLLNQSGKPHPLCDFVNPGKITLGIKS
jgi:Rrf2 family protein